MGYRWYLVYELTSYNQPHFIDLLPTRGKAEECISTNIMERTNSMRAHNSRNVDNPPYILLPYRVRYYIVGAPDARQACRLITILTDETNFLDEDFFSSVEITTAEG